MSDRASRELSKRYSRMFSAFAFGLYFLVTGAIGWNVSYQRGMFGGGRWQHGPVWWQIVVGVALLALGLYWVRRLDDPAWRLSPMPSARVVKNVGHGKSAGVVEQETHRALPGTESKS